MDKELNEKWKEYCNNVDGSIRTMWNFVLYNQFNNDEIRRLNNKNSDLEGQLKYCKDVNYKMKDDLDKLYYDNKKLKDSVDYYRKRNQDQLLNKKAKKRSRTELTELEERDEDAEWLTKVKRRIPKRYRYMSLDERDRLLLRKFEKLESIKDIIDLKNIDNLYDYLKLEKFEKLYKLIPSLERLDNMIGMNDLKEQVFKMISYFVHGLNNSEDLNHIIISGPPGVGKTTVARILGNIYRNFGFLKNNKFVVVKRSDLVAEYLGQTAVKTQKVIDSADGGVLFIDEVYSLGNKEKRDSFAKECIDTINLNLTEKSDKLLVIVAGYKDDIQRCFLDYNSGLERRFQIRFDIEKYSKEDLYKILLKFIRNDRWLICEEIKDLIYDNYELFEFMGGDMLSLFKMAKENFSLRLMKSNLHMPFMKELKKDDFKYAINKFKKSREKDVMPDYVKRMFI